ncbi:MAG: hypothetical protein O3C67_03555 [Cyanobacteria bacterium]|nr:hypothetical protein [Cyanobacteriota bacterium]
MARQPLKLLVLALLPALWIVAIAILSVQNATPVALRFLWFQSVELPLGVILSFCAAGAMVVTVALVAGFQPRAR